jgi:uncharacterized membrane-anchored protein YhcB (DUF1043 family)
MNPSIPMVGTALPGGAEIALIILFAFIPALVIIVLIRFVRFLGKANREQQLTRLELGKVADEVQKMRQELQGVSSKLQPPKQ